MTAARIQVEQNGRVVFAGDHEVLLGSRTGCDVVVHDPVVADRHCRIAWDGDAFTVRDLGSVTGTWLDGRRAGAAEALTDGAVIVIGATRVLVHVDGRGAAAALRLDVQRQAFWWTKPAKGQFDNDPDAMVRAEVDFGRFPALRLANRAAAGGALVLLLAALFVGAAFEPLANPGPLLPAHAFVHSAAAMAGDPLETARIAHEKGCAACHDGGHGPTAANCMQCHRDLAQPATWRHPWLGDGVVGEVPGRTIDERFCTTCHSDHQGADWQKPGPEALVGGCEACHAADRSVLLAKAPPPPLAAPRQRELATIVFPHDAHLAEGMACTVCHAIDPAVRAAHERGAPDEPLRPDFAAVPFALCASCHVPGSEPLEALPAADRERWRVPAERRWPVAWHGTDDGGRGCRQCHTGRGDGDDLAFEPTLRAIERPVFDADAHAAERARYVAGRRLHADEFAAHAGGRGCGECHLRGGVVPGEPEPARPFWHALHLGATMLTPPAGTAGAASLDARAGCLSCHGDRREAAALLPAGKGTFAWPSDGEAQQACRECHSDGDGTITLQATPVADAATPRREVADFPHGPHVTAAAFGQPGTALADGCFACHTFAVPSSGDALQAVPQLKPGAGDCRQCHQDHQNVGGGACQNCHPKAQDAASPFWRVAVTSATAPAQPTRAWPGANGFSHLSPGHSGPGLDGQPLRCTDCHDERATAAAKTLTAVPVPDESMSLCRDCHLQRQFHWR